MKCNEIDALLDSAANGLLNAQEREAFDRHLAGCAACRFKFQALEDCRSLDDQDEVPALFSSSWRQRIKQEEAHPVKQFPRLARWLAVSAAVLVLAGGTWLAGENRRQANPDRGDMRQMAYGSVQPYESQTAAAPMMEAAPADQAQVAGLSKERASAVKIIRTARIELSTRTFDADHAAILQALNEAGGRVEETSLYNSQGNLRVLRMTLRVPAGQLDQVIAKLRGVGKLSSFNESAQDVSEQYADTENRLKTQQIKMERLQALLARAESVEDLIAVEGSISETQYEIDRLTGEKQGMDSRVSDATLEVTLQELSPMETSQNQQEGLLSRIRYGMEAAFKGTLVVLGDLLVFLGIALPYLIALAVVILVIRLIVKRRNQK